MKRQVYDPSRIGASIPAAPAVAVLLAEELGRDEAWQQAQLCA